MRHAHRCTSASRSLPSLLPGSGDVADAFMSILFGGGGSRSPACCAPGAEPGRGNGTASRAAECFVNAHDVRERRGPPRTSDDSQQGRGLFESSEEVSTCGEQVHVQGGWLGYKLRWWLSSRPSPRPLPAIQRAHGSLRQVRRRRKPRVIEDDARPVQGRGGARAEEAAPGR